MYNYTASFVGAFGVRDADTPLLLSPFKAVTIWNLTLCKTADVSNFISVLSEVSGRDMKELTSNTWKSIRLMKRREKMS